MKYLHTLYHQRPRHIPSLKQDLQLITRHSRDHQQADHRQRDQEPLLTTDWRYCRGEGC